MSKNLYMAQQQDLISSNELGNTEYIQSVFDLTPAKVEQIKLIRPRKLGIRCKRTDHTKNLHYYGKGKGSLWVPRGSCIECGAQLVNWNEMWCRDAPDTDKFAFLQTEWIRHFFFNVPITPSVEEHALRNGLSGLASTAETQLGGKRMLTFGSPRWDSYQTPMLRGNIVDWARHAVACCCRQCLTYWHNVPLDHTLDAGDVEYFKRLIMRYILRRFPGIGSEPE